MITISHTHADGTLVYGTSKDDGTAAILRAARFRWFPSIKLWGVAQSRDHLAKRWQIDSAAKALRAAGHEVTVSIDETERRSFAEAEAERNERAEDRAERMAGYAANAAARATALHAEAERMAEAIPFGQPILVDHYSANSDRRYRARMVGKFERSFAEMDKAEHYEHRAASAETYQASRESVPTTLRRIAKIEAEQRDIQRRLDGRPEYVSDGEGGHKVALVRPEGAYLERLTVLAADKADQLAYWRGVVAAKQAEGVKVWGPSDFAKGDFVRTRWEWAEVTRVNPRSVTIAWDMNSRADVIRASTAPGRRPWPYDKVQGRKSASEIGEMQGQAAS